MKKIMTATLLATSLASCTTSGYKISGTAELNPGDSIFLMSSEREVLGAGVVTDDQTFEFKGKTESPSSIYITTSREGGVISNLYLENGDITITEDGSATGTPLNDAFTELTQRVMEVTANSQEASEEQQEAIFEEFQGVITETISANLDNVLGANLFAQYEASQFGLSTQEIEARLKSFSEEMQQSEQLKDVAQRLQAMAATAIGEPYINITLKNTAGEQVSLSDIVAKGKYTLIDFWATWCPPCMGEMPHLKQAYKKYASKGFEIYGVSLDNDPQKWAAFANTLDWVNVINDESDATDEYAVSAIPTNFLISPEGKIIAKNLRGEAIEEELAKWLEK